MNPRHILFASMLGLSSTMAIAQAPAPGHDMNEQNALTPGMRETMRVQGGGASGSTTLPVTGHDMNEQNIHQPTMHDQMRREATTGATPESARAANPGHEMNPQNIHRPGMHEEMRKQ